MKVAKIISKLPRRLQINFIKYLKYLDLKSTDRIAAVSETIIKLINQEKEVDFRNLVEKLKENRAYNDQSIRKDLNEIQNRLIEFLSIEEFKNSKLLQNRLALKAISNFELDELLHSFYNKSILHSSEMEKKSADQIFELYLLKTIKYNQSNNFFSRQFSPGTNDLNEIKNTFDLLKEFFAIETYKLKEFENMILTPHNLFHFEKGIDLPKFFFNSIKEGDLLMLYKNINTFRAKGTRTLGVICLEKLRNIDSFSINEFETLYISLTNVFVYYNKKGDSTFDDLHLRLQKIAIQKGLYNLKISIPIYRNIILLASKQEDFQWALDFSNNFKSKLPTNDQETAYSFNKARIYINMKKYEDVIATLRDVEYKDITYNLNSKLMLMVSFYELNEYETLLSTIRAFKVFLRRRRNVSIARKANFTDFCDALYNIMLAEQNRDVKRIRKAKEILAGNPAIPNSTLLKEKIEELKL